MTFPSWFLIALAGHLANGAAFLIDKTLLKSAFKRPATYAGIIGLIGILALVLIPFGVSFPDTRGLAWMVVSGAAFTISLWIFFAALSAGEASRVVPVVGSLIPILTLAGTATFLGERLSTGQFGGFALLVVATIVLSGGASKSRLTPHTMYLAILAAALFAASSVTGKVAYDSYGFLTTFTVSRLAGVVTAVLILLSDQEAVREVMNAFFGGKKTADGPTGRIAGIMIIVGQTLGGLGFVGVQYATSMGSAALVNALQAIQYTFLVLVAFLFRKKAKELLGEDLTPAAVTRKLIAIAIAAVGLWLVV